jgi:hypothetical protein
MVLEVTKWSKMKTPSLITYEFLFENIRMKYTYDNDELDGPAVSALRCAITEVKQRWSVIRWVTKSLLSRAPPCFGRHVKPLSYGPFSLCVIHRECLYPSSGDINRLMMYDSLFNFCKCFFFVFLIA